MFRTMTIRWYFWMGQEIPPLMGLIAERGQQQAPVIPNVGRKLVGG